LNESISIEQRGRFIAGRFFAMASPCELLIDGGDQRLAEHLTRLAAAEAWRIEAKFSRYQQDNVMAQINGSHGQPITVDEETARLLDFAGLCHALSDGRFDVTSGILRRVWRFDGSDRLPTRKQVKELLPLVGWDKVGWRPPHITLQPGMELDLGGIGKEYAVDHTAKVLSGHYAGPLLVNYGGDLFASGPPAGATAWQVGVESLGKSAAADQIDLVRGGVTTSGDANRYLLRNNKRYSHVLNPRTGWPVSQAPRSVTVAAGTCLQAGMLSTIAMLHGKNAEAFLASQEVRFWVQR